MAKLEAVNCPSCAAPITVSSGTIKCDFCGRIFEIADKKTGRLTEIPTKPVSKQPPPRPTLSGKLIFLGFTGVIFLIISIIVGVTINDKVRNRTNVNDMKLSPDGKYLVTAHGVGLGVKANLRLWNAADGKELRTINVDDICWSLAWSPNSKYVAVGLHSGKVTIYDTSTWQIKNSMDGLAGFIDNLAWSPDSKYVAAGDDNGAVWLWEVENGKLYQKFIQQNKNISQIAFSPDGRYLASGSWDDSVKVMDVVNKSAVYSFNDHNSFVSALAWSADSRYLATGALDNMVYVYDITSGTRKYALSGHTHSISYLQWSGDGQYLASCAQTESLRLWRADTGEMAQVIATNNSYGETNFYWSPDSKKIASPSKGDLAIWDLNGQAISKVRISNDTSYNNIKIADWTKDGKIYYSDKYGNDMGIIDGNNGQRTIHWKIPYLKALF